MTECQSYYTYSSLVKKNKKVGRIFCSRPPPPPPYPPFPYSSISLWSSYFSVPVSSLSSSSSFLFSRRCRRTPLPCIFPPPRSSIRSLPPSSLLLPLLTVLFLLDSLSPINLYSPPATSPRHDWLLFLSSEARKGYHVIAGGA